MTANPDEWLQRERETEPELFTCERCGARCTYGNPCLECSELLADIRDIAETAKRHRRESDHYQLKSDKALVPWQRDEYRALSDMESACAEAYDARLRGLHIALDERWESSHSENLDDAT